MTYLRINLKTIYVNLGWIQIGDLTFTISTELICIGNKVYEAWRLVPPQNLWPGGTL